MKNALRALLTFLLLVCMWTTIALHGAAFA